MNATRVLPKCMFNEARTEVTNVRDPMTGEVFEGELYTWLHSPFLQKSCRMAHFVVDYIRVVSYYKSMESKANDHD